MTSSDKTIRKKISKRNAIKSRMHPLMIVMLIILILWSAIMLFCLGWALISTFKENFFDFRNNMFGLPQEWVFDNYEIVWREFYVPVDGNAIFVERLFAHSLFFVFNETLPHRRWYGK